MNIITGNYMVPAFHFRVLFSGLQDITEQDSSFESVTGIGAAVMDDIQISSHEKNNPVAFQPVVLRRAIAVPGRSGLRTWVLKCLNQHVHEPLQQVKIEVLNEEQAPALVVVLKDVYVKTWALGELHAQNSNLLMEEISLGYRSIEVF
jgi:phage tail-like protein